GNAEGLRLGEPPARRGQNSPMDTLLKRPTREPRPPARLRPGGDSVPEGRAYAPEGTEKKPIIFRLIGAMQSVSVQGKCIDLTLSLINMAFLLFP
ncbi:MAG: hypothetical protein ACQEQO_11055, partial [Thermodesulfobacteriota bacterium]